MQNQMKPMTLEEAINFLDSICANTSLGRQAHIQGMQAVATLKAFIPSENGNGSQATEESDGPEKQKETEK